MIATKLQALAEVRRRKWLRPALMEHLEGGRYFVHSKLSSNIYEHGNTLEEAFAEADRREKESRVK